MKASLNLAILCALPAAAAAQQPASPAAGVPVIISALTTCVDAVGRNGVQEAILTAAGWRQTAAGTFEKDDAGLSIALPPDADGGHRICVVSAALNDEGALRLLKGAISRSFRASAIEQSNSTIWMFPRHGTRGIQLYPEGIRTAPRVRLIAAFFSERQ